MKAKTNELKFVNVRISKKAHRKLRQAALDKDLRLHQVIELLVEKLP